MLKTFKNLVTKKQEKQDNSDLVDTIHTQVDTSDNSDGLAPEVANTDSATVSENVDEEKLSTMQDQFGKIPTIIDDEMDSKADLIITKAKLRMKGSEKKSAKETFHDYLTEEEDIYIKKCAQMRIAVAMKNTIQECLDKGLAVSNNDIDRAILLHVDSIHKTEQDEKFEKSI